VDVVVSLDLMDEPTWRSRAAAHAERVDAFVAPHLARRQSQVKHPVHDFLFTYYSQRPGQLRRWHPGFGTALGGDASSYASLKGYVETQVGGRAGVTVSEAYVVSQQPALTSLHALLSATASRPAHTGCFGLHEWAMVYQQGEEETRHADWPLRLGPDGTDAVVESHSIGCSHFDAFRFFTPPARSLNLLSPTSADRPDFEQPGCLHAGMDLYKHAFRLTPMICSDLVADCFDLAREIRLLDMRAAPYDLSSLGVEPVRIETAEGKKVYAAAQRVFADRGAPLRQRLVEECERLMTGSSV
jgi:hypothetical protein